MNKPFHVGLATANLLRLLFVGTILVLAGRTFDASGQTLTTPWSFTNAVDGANPYAGLVQGSDGNFYGTASCGGANTNIPSTGNFPGAGAVFRISPGGSFTNLHSFNGNDGALPIGGLVQGADGNFYGTTFNGGTNGDENGYNGTVFRITPSGSLTMLWSFTGLSDGAAPNAGLVYGSDGNFYGTAIGGGSNIVFFGGGTLFRITPSGSLTNLHSFSTSGATGLNAGLVQGTDGGFYGATEFGGASANCSRGCGSVFKLLVPLNPPANQINRIQLSGADIVVGLLSVASETYQLQFSGSMNPTNWVNVAGASVTNSIGALMSVTNFGGAVGPQGFYRFDITP